MVVAPGEHGRGPALVELIQQRHADPDDVGKRHAPAMGSQHIGGYGADGVIPRKVVLMSPRLLWIIAVAIAVIGIVVLFTGNILWGILLLILAALVGPGGVSIFRRRVA